MPSHPLRTKWSVAKLAYTAQQRNKIMESIRSHNQREKLALEAVPLDYPWVRAQIRDWFFIRWRDMLSEYERVLPHVDELPEEENKNV